MFYIDVHTHQIITDEKVISIKNQYPTDLFDVNTYFSVGIHPWFLDQKTVENELFLMEHQLKNQHCIALGECGLDTLCKTDFELQKKVFIQQLYLAEKYQKPVIMHCVKAHQVLIEILQKEKINSLIILHGFSKKERVHHQLMGIPNIYFSFGNAILLSKTTQKNLIDTPLERFFLETDQSKVSIKTLYQQTSIIKNISIESLKNQLFLNFQNIFKTNLST